MLIASFFDKSNEALIITGIKIASYTYGILLSLFILSKMRTSVSSFAIIVGMLFGLVSVFIASYFGVFKIQQMIFAI